MRKALHITDSDSVAPETPRDAQDLAYVANGVLGFDPTLKQLVTQLHKHTVLIPVVALANLANSMVLKVAVPYPFILNSINFRVGDKAVTTAAKTVTVQAKISGTNVTGGTVDLVSADLGTTGATKALSAITGANTGAADGTIEIECSSVTAFVEGNGWFECNVTRKTA